MNRLLALAAILLVLVAIAWGTGMLSGPASTVDVPTLRVDSDAVTAIAVRSAGEHVRATRTAPGAWELETPSSAKADTATVNRILKQVGDIELESIVSTNPERFSKFEVDSTGNELTIEWGDGKIDLIVGKMGPDFQSRYVRMSGDDRVMLANGLPNLTAKLDQWRDKTLWSFPADAIKSVSVTTEGATYGLLKEGTSWALNSDDGAVPADSAKVASLIDRLSPMKVDGFLTSLTVDSVLANVTHQLRIERVDGSAETLLMRKRSNDVAAIREGSADVFKLFPYRLANLTPPIANLTAAE